MTLHETELRRRAKAVEAVVEELLPLYEAAWGALSRAGTASAVRPQLALAVAQQVMADERKYREGL